MKRETILEKTRKGLLLHNTKLPDDVIRIKIFS